MSRSICKLTLRASEGTLPYVSFSNTPLHSVDDVRICFFAQQSTTTLRAELQTCSFFCKRAPQDDTAGEAQAGGESMELTGDWQLERYPESGVNPEFKAFNAL